MATLAEGMPNFVNVLGVWEGEYIYTAPDGTIRDRHRSRLTCRLSKDDPEVYLQRNEYFWETGAQAGKTECFDFRFLFDGQKLCYDHPRAIGYCWEEPKVVGDLVCIRVSWQRSDAAGYGDYDITQADVHELIQVDRSTMRRGRVWQWFSEGDLFLRTIIKEHRTATVDSITI
jgi:hypothetical protein